MADPTAEKAGRGRRLPSWKRMERRLTVFFECGDRTTRKRSRFRRVYCYLRRISDAYSTHQCALLAGACAYFAILSVVPLLAVGVALFGFVLGSSETALTTVFDALSDYVPVAPEYLKRLLVHVMEDKRLVGSVGLLGLFFTSTQTFLAMEPAMNIIWSVPETRNLFHQRFTAMGVTIFTLVLLSLDLTASAMFAYVETQHIPFLPGHVEAMLLRIGVGLVPLILTTLMFVQIYRYLPARTIPWKPALLGGLVGALLWQASKILFSISLIYVNSYGRLYGSFGSLAILVVWIYYSMAILLLGAEIAADYEFVRHSLRAATDRAHSGADLATARGTPHLSHPVELDEEPDEELDEERDEEPNEEPDGESEAPEDAEEKEETIPASVRQERK